MMRQVAFFACVFFVISQQSLVAQEVRSLNDIFLDLDDASESVARTIADLQAKEQWKMDQGPLYKSTPPKENRDPNIATDDLIFEGYFQPFSDQTTLAIFSDDGCDVWIDSVLVLNNFKKPQHLPTLQQSFRLLKTFKPIAGQLYQIKIRYANTIYLGKTDIDGCTLFAFKGGGNGVGKPVIKRKRDGEPEYKDIDASNSNVLPGELIDLKMFLDPPPPAVMERVWTLSPIVFKDYKPNNEKSNFEGGEKIDKSKETIQFYWANGDDKEREIVAKAKIKNQWIGKAKLKVRKLSVELTAKIGEVCVGPYTLGGKESTYLILAKDCKGGLPGIQFEAKVKVPADFDLGKWGFVQLVAEKGWVQGKKLKIGIDTKGEKYLDTSFPYAGFFTTGDALQYTNDSPNMILVKQLTKASMELHSFSMYTIFKPKGNQSKYVPLQQIDWYWKGSASKDATGGWSLDKNSGDKKANPAVDTTNHPKWEKNIKGVKPVPITMKMLSRPAMVEMLVDSRSAAASLCLLSMPFRQEYLEVGFSQVLSKLARTTRAT